MSACISSMHLPKAFRKGPFLDSTKGRNFLSLFPWCGTRELRKPITWSTSWMEDTDCCIAERRSQVEGTCNSFPSAVISQEKSWQVEKVRVTWIGDDTSLPPNLAEVILASFELAWHQWYGQTRAYPGPGPGIVGMCPGNAKNYFKSENERDMLS